MCVGGEQRRAYLLQVAAVVGAHVGQGRLLLRVLTSLLLGICLLPLQPLLLLGSEHQADVSYGRNLLAEQCGDVVWGSSLVGGC